MTSSKLPRTLSGDDMPLWRSMLAEHESAAVVAAIKFGLFDTLQKNGPLGLADLMLHAGLSRRGLAAILATVHALGYLVTNENGAYANTSSATTFLTSDSQFFWGPMLLRSARTAERLVRQLETESRSSQPKEDLRLKHWESGVLEDMDQAKQIAAAMQAHSLIPAFGLAEKVDLNKEFGITKFLDIGGGSGIFSLAFVSRQPNLQAVVVELPLASAVAQSYIDADTSTPRKSVTTHTMNMFKDPFPPANEWQYNAMFLSNILHDWDEETCVFLCQKIHDALPNSGILLIHEALLNEPSVRTGGPLLTALFSVHMFLHTKGKQFTFSELRSLLERCGFSHVRAMQTHGIYSLVSAEKRGG